jgi:ribosomal protein S18 acetylase RimI-like enzyme
MEYKVAEKNDLLKIIELYKQLSSSNDDFQLEKINKIWDNIENNNIKYFIVKENSEIIGSCYIAIIPNLTFNGKSIGYIENVITDEKHRRRGIGKRLMEMAVKYAQEEDCYKVVLQSGIRRIEAHKFYESIGFDGKSKKAYELRF